MDDAIASGGSAGLFSLISLLLTLEARLFVITARSHWGMLINSVRTAALDPTCGGCTDALLVK